MFFAARPLHWLGSLGVFDAHFWRE